MVALRSENIAFRRSEKQHMFLFAFGPIPSVRTDDNGWTGQWVLPRSRALPVRDRDENEMAYGDTSRKRLELYQQK